MLRSWQSPLFAAGPRGLGSCDEIAAVVLPAHGVDSLCRGHSSLDQAALERIKRGGRPRGHANLGIKALDMVVGGFRRDIELARRLFRRVAARYQAEDFDLARSQSGQALGRIPAGGLAGARKHRLDRFGAELSLPDSTAELG